MGKFVELVNNDVVKYEALTSKPFDKVFALERILKFYKFQFFGSVKSSEVFYDTPNDLLYKAGVVLSRVQEDDRVFFKVAQAANSNLKTNTQKVFSHKIGLRDTIKDHSFYLVDGIRGLFNTPFSIDLENVVKNSIPKISVTINANVYKVISGSGFRAFMCHEDIHYENHESKRQQKANGMTIKLSGPEQYMPEFKEFNKAIQKHCKEFVLVHENLYEHSKKITKKIDPKQAKEDLKKAKEMIANRKSD